ESTMAPVGGASYPRESRQSDFRTKGILPNEGKMCRPGLCESNHKESLLDRGIDFTDLHRPATTPETRRSISDPSPSLPHSAACKAVIPCHAQAGHESTPTTGKPTPSPCQRSCEPTQSAWKA